MTYVARLRVRRLLLRYGTFVAIVFALGVASLIAAIAGSHGSFHTGSHGFGSHSVHGKIVLDSLPFSWIVTGAMTIAYLIVPALGANLDAEYRSAAIAFTRPISRYAIAARYFAVDAAGYAIASVMGMVVALSFLGSVNMFRYVSFGSEDAMNIVLAITVAIMWYGWVLFAGALFPGRGNAMIGVSWAFALIMPSIALMPLPTLMHDLALGITYLDPLAYVGSSSEHSSGLLTFTSVGMRTLVSFAIGVVAIVAGTGLWATREVTA